ncbi:GntR family transcriptional regulator [Acidisoma silvae]|uniref:UTRA domain-containing protein n=1 Tax=Acidisoma silvae TaxID=2802396 RepID=A0A963YUU4_9PROT|nr:GntR family transcriptional regulator [Acidisoma silvae]MCB8877476.1 UTRA domain-containing protein [Acidisoma silvae]
MASSFFSPNPTRSLTTSMSKAVAFPLDGQGPLFRQIGRSVTGLILEGLYKPGEKLPSEEELTEIFQTSRQTINKAIGELARNGLVERNRRAGTVISLRYQRQFAIPLREVSEDIIASGKDYEFRITERRLVKNGEAGDLWRALPRGARLLYIEALHLADDYPVQLETRFINIAAVPQVEKEHFQEMSPGKWLLHHIKWSEVDHAVRAVNASPDMAKKLMVAEGAPLLVIERQTFHHEKPITMVCLTNPGDRFEIKGRLSLGSDTDHD